MKLFIQKIILTICAVTIAFCGWNIYYHYESIHQASISMSKYTTQVKADKDSEKVVSPVSYDEMYARNTDYKAWLWFSSGLVSQPVMQTFENNYYLDHGIDRDEKTIGGTAFIDASNSMTDQNITIYGHNYYTDAGSYVFGPLRLLLNQTTYDQNQRFYMEWKDGIKTYQIFAVCDIDVSQDDWDYTQNIFYSDSEFFDFVRTAKKHSAVSTDVDVKATDNLITLQTCTMTGESNRTVVIAKELK